MNTPDWFPTAAKGAVVGVVAAIVLGFSFGAVMTTGAANKMASDQAEAAVADALTPICVAQFKEEEDLDAQIAAFHEIKSWKRVDYVKAQGWATMPGNDKPERRSVVNTCVEAIEKEFPKT